MQGRKMSIVPLACYATVLLTMLFTATRVTTTLDAHVENSYSYNTDNSSHVNPCEVDQAYLCNLIVPRSSNCQSDECMETGKHVVWQYIKRIEDFMFGDMVVNTANCPGSVSRPLWRDMVADRKGSNETDLHDPKQERNLRALGQMIAAPLACLGGLWDRHAVRRAVQRVEAGHQDGMHGRVQGVQVLAGGQRLPFGAQGMVFGSHYISSANASNTYYIEEEFAEFTDGMIGKQKMFAEKYTGTNNYVFKERYWDHSENRIKFSYRHAVDVPYGTCISDLDLGIGESYYLISENNQYVKQDVPLEKYGSEFSLHLRLRGGGKMPAKPAKKATTKKTTVEESDDEDQAPPTFDKDKILGYVTNADGTKTPIYKANFDALPSSSLSEEDEAEKAAADKAAKAAPDIVTPKISDDFKNLPQTLAGKFLMQQYKNLKTESLEKFMSDCQNLLNKSSEEDEFMSELLERIQNLDLNQQKSSRTKPLGNVPQCSRLFNSEQYETYRTEISLWHDRNISLPNGDIAVLILASLDETTKIFIISSMKGQMNADFSFATFIQIMDLRFHRNKLQMDMRYEAEYRNMVQQNQTTAEFTQALKNAHSKLQIQRFVPESGFAIKLLSKYRTITQDKRTTLTTLILEKQNSKISEWKIANEILDILEIYGQAQELSKAAAPEKPQKVRYTATENEVYTATENEQPQQPKGGKYGGKHGGKHGKGKGNGKGKGAQFGKGAVWKDIRKAPWQLSQADKNAKKDYSKPPARPPQAWDVKKDWVCSLCNAFNYTFKKASSEKATICYYCKKQKNPKKPANVESTNVTKLPSPPEPAQKIEDKQP